MNTVKEILSQLIESTNECNRELFQAQCMTNDLKYMGLAIQDLRIRSLEKEDDVSLAMSDKEKIDFHFNIRDLDKVLEQIKYSNNDVELFEEVKDTVELMYEHADKVSLQDALEMLVKVSTLKTTFESFNQMASELEKQLFDGLNNTSVGGVPYLNVEGMLDKVQQQ